MIALMILSMPHVLGHKMNAGFFMSFARDQRFLYTLVSDNQWPLCLGVRSYRLRRHSLYRAATLLSNTIPSLFHRRSRRPLSKEESMKEIGL